MKIVALLARSHGLAALRALLGAKHEVDVWTYNNQPEYRLFEDALKLFGIPGVAIATHAMSTFWPAVCPSVEWADLLVSVNWRHKVPADILALPKYGGLNLHRGKLPEYAGASPVKRAIEAGETYAYLTAHRMTDVIDGGPVLVETAVRCRSGLDAVQATIDAMEAHVGPTLMAAIDKLTEEG